MERYITYSTLMRIGYVVRRWAAWRPWGAWARRCGLQGAVLRVAGMPERSRG